MSFQSVPSTEILKCFHQSLLFPLFSTSLWLGLPPPFLHRFVFDKEIEQKLEYLNRFFKKDMHRLHSLFLAETW